MIAAAARTCGGCTLCCTVMGIAELAKPAGAGCPHCVSGSHCSIYGGRPGSCRSFRCQWLANPTLPASLRPDRSGVVLTVSGEPERLWLIANCEAADPLAWRRAPIYPWLKQQARLTWGSGAAVLANALNRFWLIAPEEDRDLGEIADGAAIEVEVRNTGSFIVRHSPTSGQ